jgi:hypothetical protein
MKKSAAVLALIILLPLLSASVASTTKAQDIPTHGDGVTIWSPCNRTYAPNDNITISAQLEIRYANDLAFSGNYTIDNGPPQILGQQSFRTSFWSVTYGCLGANTVLPKLPEGQHKLTIHLSTEYINATPPFVLSGKVTVYFTIATAKEAQNLPTYGDGATIYSPCNRTYDRNEVIAINASSSAFAGQDMTYSGTYSIDGHGSYPSHTEMGPRTNYWPYGTMVGTAELPSLPEGQHKLTIYLESYTGPSNGHPTMSSEATVYFTIGDLNPPKIALKAIDGVVFNHTSVPLNFTINEPTSWSAYCLDNDTQTTITTNTTLTAAAGNHTLRVYANDTAGNMGQSEVAHFTVQTPETSEPQTGNTTALIATVLVITAIAGFVLILRQKTKYSR